MSATTPQAPQRRTCDELVVKQTAASRASRILLDVRRTSDGAYGFAPHLIGLPLTFRYRKRVIALGFGAFRFTAQRSSPHTTEAEDNSTARKTMQLSAIDSIVVALHFAPTSPSASSTCGEPPATSASSSSPAEASMVPHSRVTDFTRLRGRSTSTPRSSAM